MSARTPAMACLLVALLHGRAGAIEPDAAPTPVPRVATPGPPPLRRIVVNELAAARYNPHGPENHLRAGWQQRLFESDSRLARDNFLFLGVLAKLNPAYSRAGPAVEVQPLSILNVRVAVDHVRFFSTFGFLQSFPTPTAAYSERVRSANERAGANYAASGVHAILEPTFQFKVGSVVVRERFAAEYWSVDIHRGDSVFYEATLDTLLPGRGTNIANDADLLYVTRFGLIAGARHTLVQPIYSANDFQPGEDPGWSRNGHHRLGALFAYTFYDRGRSRFDRPTLVLICSWYLRHRYRTGEDVSPGIPYLVFGFQFQSDLLK